MIEGAGQKCHQESTPEDIGKQLLINEPKDRAECWRGSFISVTMRISVWLSQMTITLRLAGGDGELSQEISM